MPPITCVKFENKSTIFFLIVIRGVITAEIDLSFDDSLATGLIQKVESQIKKIIAVMETETVRAIALFSLSVFLLNLSIKLNILYLNHKIRSAKSEIII